MPTPNPNPSPRQAAYRAARYFAQSAFTLWLHRAVATPGFAISHCASATPYSYTHNAPGGAYVVHMRANGAIASAHWVPLPNANGGL